MIEITSRCGNYLKPGLSFMIMCTDHSLLDLPFVYPPEFTLSQSQF